ncbi:MAG: MBL fold metallo-hydrolase [Planctomycetota bacterium]|nr:MAG: MBL fold metallo-hydrolase [Planctomycetota bacterium]
MKLVLLGTTGYHPSQRGHTACLMLPEVGIVLDAGTAMFRVHERLCTPQLDIFLTHAHLDHVVGLTYLQNVVRDKQLERVTVHASPKALGAIQEHLLAEALFPAQPPCEFRALAETVPLAQSGRLSWFRLEHPGGAVGFRLDWPDCSMAYVTDTTASAAAPYVEALRGVDLLVHECNYPDAKAELAQRWGHSATSAVAEVARQASVGRLVLTHLDPTAGEEDPLGLEAARRIFPSTTLGHDLLELEF